ncbi:MAG: hypothetical protein MK108_11610 [Mariniblastus sp.]|nr:hypothetical protein [Mariniblastus sp.]
MVRRRDRDDTDVSLFPFLSILACIIGVLTLLISTLALSQMDSDVVVRAEEYESLSAALAEQQASLKELQQSLTDQQLKMASQASTQQQELLAKQQQLKQLQNQFLIAQKRQNELIQKEEPEDAPQQQPLSELEQELAGLKEQVAQLMLELEQKKRPEEAEVTVVPGGSGRGIKPYFVECTKNGIALQQGAGWVQIRPANIEKSEPLLKLLDTVKGDPKAKLIFLIRQDGVSAWWRAKRFADSLDVANGKLPVIGQGKLNLERVEDK